MPAAGAEELIVICDEPLRASELRSAVHRGMVVRRPASAASLALVEAAWEVLRQAFDALPLEDLPDREFLDRLSRARARLMTPDVLRLAAAVVSEAGLEPRLQYFDAVRLRVVRPGGHRSPAARHAYSLHRDTWFANPRAQLNWWIPLHDVEAGRTFEFLPDLFGAAVENDSRQFDYDEWKRRVGFQNPNAPSDAPYPSAHVTAARREGFSARAGEAIVFSAAHLHATRGHDGREARLSLDFRTVDRRDLAEDRGAPDPDNDSKGSALVDYVEGASLR